MPSEAIFLPGLNNTAAVFDDVVAALHGAVTPHVFELPVLESTEEIAEDILSRSPERFYLCGFSFGGYVALAMLERAPERIEGLILIGSGPAADTPERRKGREAAIAGARAGKHREQVLAQVLGAFHPDNIGNAALMAKRAAMVTAYGAEKFIAHSTASLARPDRYAALAKLVKPLLLIAGDRDSLCPAASLSETARAAPSAKTVVVPGAGHLVPLERPLDVAASIRDWLASG